MRLASSAHQSKICADPMISARASASGLPCSSVSTCAMVVAAFAHQDSRLAQHGARADRPGLRATAAKPCSTAARASSRSAGLASGTSAIVSPLRRDRPPGTGRALHRSASCRRRTAQGRRRMTVVILAIQKSLPRRRRDAGQSKRRAAPMTRVWRSATSRARMRKAGSAGAAGWHGRRRRWLRRSGDVRPCPSSAFLRPAKSIAFPVHQPVDPFNKAMSAGR